jgi:hypothetical protein
MRLEARKYLYDIEQAAARLEGFVAGKTLENRPRFRGTDL